MPLIVTRIVPRTLGIEAEGTLFTSAGTEVVFRIVQASPGAQYYRTQGDISLGYLLVQNVGAVLSALNASPVFLKQEPDLQHLTMRYIRSERRGRRR